MLGSGVWVLWVGNDGKGFAVCIITELPCWQAKRGKAVVPFGVLMLECINNCGRVGEVSVKLNQKFRSTKQIMRLQAAGGREIGWWICKWMARLPMVILSM